MSIYHVFDVVGLSGETQLQVGENLKKIKSQRKMLIYKTITYTILNTLTIEYLIYSHQIKHHIY